MRVANWPIVLAGKVEEWRSRPFAYGTSDCLQFVADISTALTGEDRRALFPPYTNREEAEAIIAMHGSEIGILKRAFGKPKHRPTRGDVVLADFGAGMGGGICLGVNCCSPGEHGLVFRPTAVVQLAWSI